MNRTHANTILSPIFTIFFVNNYPSLQAMYSATDDNTEVLYLKDAVATICSFEKEPVVIQF